MIDKTTIVVIHGKNDKAEYIQVAHMPTERSAVLYMKATERKFEDGRWIRCEYVEDWKPIYIEPKSRVEFGVVLTRLDDRSIQKIMREVDSQELAVALKGLELEEQEKIFRNMSKRASEMLKEDMDYMGPVTKTYQNDTRERIMKVMDYLVESGEIPDPSIEEELIS